MASPKKVVFPHVDNAFNAFICWKVTCQSRQLSKNNEWPTADPPNITFKLLRAVTSEEGNKDLTLGRGSTKGRSSGRGSKRVQTATMQIWPSRRVRSLERVCVCVKLCTKEFFTFCG